MSICASVFGFVGLLLSLLFVVFSLMSSPSSVALMLFILLFSLYVPGVWLFEKSFCMKFENVMFVRVAVRLYE